MTVTVSVSHAALDRTSDKAIELSQELINLFVSARDSAQLALPLEGHEQAFDAFMEEREELKSAIVTKDAQIEGQKVVIEQLAESIQNDDVYKDALRREISQGTNALQHVAVYNTALQEALNSIGIRFEPAEDGSPAILVNPDMLIGFVSNL